MNSLNVFNNPEFGQVRTVMIDNTPWFVGKDIADDLGYQNGSRDINRHVDDDDRQKIMVFDGNQNKETIVINESGLYSLILHSKLPAAKKFKRWVTSEVLPTLRKNGAYSIPNTPSAPTVIPFPVYIPISKELEQHLMETTTMQVMQEVLGERKVCPPSSVHTASVIRERANSFSPYPFDNQKFSNYLKRNRVSQSLMARASGINRNCIYSYCKSVSPGDDNRKKICDALNLPMDYFDIK